VTRTEPLTTSTTSSPPVPDRVARPMARSALALGGGALVALSMPPWGFWPLAFVGIVLFLVALGDGPRRGDRMLLGWLFGAGWMYLGLAWMVQLTLPGYLVAGAVFAAFHLVAELAVPRGPLEVIVRPATHALAEAVRFSFPFGGVPLATLGMSQVAGPIGGVVRVGGVILLTWLVFQVCAAAVVLARRRRGAAIDRAAAAALVVSVVIVGLSFVAPRGSATGDTMRIAAIQGGGEQGTTALEVPPRLVTERHLDATRSIPDDTDLDLVLWPENTINVRVFPGSEIAAAIAAEASRLGAPVAVGVTEEPRVNSQTLVATDGEILGRYVKVRRVPYGEYVPLRGPLEAIGAPVGQVGRDAVKGTGPAILDLPDGTRAAVVISWEVFFAGRAREGVRLGAEVILNPTNGASYTGTIVQTQQVASSRLRAIEHGRWVVQAAPTGFTAVIDADGTVRQRTGVSERKILFDTVELRTGRTWYTNLGDAPFIAALVVTVLAGYAVTRRARA
jgi:apolipoprotein N-acyltransferase